MMNGRLPVIVCGKRVTHSTKFERGIHIGECLVKNKEGLAWMLVINTGFEDVNFIIPPVELEEFIGTPVAIRTIQQAKW